MTSAWTLGLSLSAAMIYVVAVLALKRSAELGAGLWHSAVVSNLVAAGLFQVLLGFGGHVPLSKWWQPCLIALLFLAGQLCALWALQSGDVSVATPLLSLKIIFVALFTTFLLRQNLPLSLWMAAILCTLGVAALNYRGAHPLGVNVVPTLLGALGAATCYASFDVLVQKWSPGWGLGRLLPLVMSIVGVLSLGLVPLFPSPLRALSGETKRWLWGGAGLFALASLVFTSGVAHFGQATLANVLYSSRGIWSIGAVALFGSVFGLREGKLGASILRWRAAGAALMFAAIALALS